MKTTETPDNLACNQQKMDIAAHEIKRLFDDLTGDLSQEWPDRSLHIWISPTKDVEYLPVNSLVYLTFAIDAVPKAIQELQDIYKNEGFKQGVAAEIRAEKKLLAEGYVRLDVMLRKDREPLVAFVGEEEMISELQSNLQRSGISVAQQLPVSTQITNGGRAQDELRLTCSVTHSDQGWRVHFQPNIAPYFGLEPHYTLLELIKRVESRYPQYRPRLTNSQLANYASQLDSAIHQGTSSIPEAVSALMRCAPPELLVSKKIALQQDAKRAFETGQGLSEVLKQFTPLQQKHQFNQNNQRAQTL
jgi:hypothetical protein